MSKSSKSFLRRIYKLILKSMKGASYRPVYRVNSIEETETGEYEVQIQLIGKNLIFKTKPEEILSDDKMTDKFSPRDVRALTYLGYLGINSPKYRILAKRLAEDERMVFIVQQKGSKNVQMKTASEIAKDESMIKELKQEEAHMVGYTAASEHMLDEKQQMAKAREQLRHQTKTIDKKD